MRPVPEAAIDFVAKHEGCRLTAYPDPASELVRTGEGSGAPWTIGYGHTAGVKEGQRITRETARAYLAEDLEDAGLKLEAKIGDVVHELTENQYAALLSFVFNLGTGNPKNREWTIWGLLRKKQFDQVPGQLIKFVNAGNPPRKMQGLVNRRTDEIKLWSTDEPGSENIQLTSAVTRSTPTPPTPTDPTPPRKSATVWGALTAPFAGIWLALQAWGAMILDWLSAAPDFVKQAISAVDPFADKSPIAEAIQTGLATAAAALGVFVAWRVFQKKRQDQA